jgi:site-specific DNA-methyltransferase (adenine-specific)
MQTNIIHLQDCVQGMLALPEKSVDIVATSPPYNLGIAYGTYQDNKPRQEYLAWLDTVFAAVKHCLKDDGHFWLNMGYSNVDPWVGMDVGNVARNHFVLQNNFTWVKSITINDVTTGHFKPINSERFANPTWEHLFHFTKTGNVVCDKLAVGVPYMWDCNIDNSARIKGRMAKKYGFKDIKDFKKNATDAVKEQFELAVAEKLSKQKPKPDTRCRGNSWYIPYDTIANREKHRGSHPATFPVALIEQCIKFSGVKEGVLVDPFMGSGTSAIAAIRQDIDYIGFDIDKDYRQFAMDRINDEIKTLNPELDFLEKPNTTLAELFIVVE